MHSSPAGPDYDGLMESLKQLQSEKLKCVLLILYAILKRGKKYLWSSAIHTCPLQKLILQMDPPGIQFENGPKSSALVRMVLTAKGTVMLRILLLKQGQL